jgi:hypothetical protein
MPAQTVANEKWILTVKELHLGHCKETFRAGAVIELDEANGRLIIDGRRFNDTRDLDVLKRHSENNPDDPWVIPYSAEAKAEVIASVRPRPVSQQKTLRPDQKLQVIQSDQDLSEEIDISETKVSKVNAAAKETARNKVKTNGMEIIRGDESVEERLASLKGKTDIGSIAERARLKSSGAVKMAVVKDDSLGAGFGGKNHPSMNAGQHLPSREEAEAKKEDAVAMAASRKKEAEQRRTTSETTGDEGDTGGQAEVSEAVGEVSETSEDAEKTALRAENADLKSRMDRLEKMMVASQTTAPRRGRPPKAKNPEPVEA